MVDFKALVFVRQNELNQRLLIHHYGMLQDVHSMRIHCAKVRIKLEHSPERLNHILRLEGIMLHIVNENRAEILILLLLRLLLNLSVRRLRELTVNQGSPLLALILFGT